MNIKISEDENEITFPRVEFVEDLPCYACKLRSCSCDNFPCGRCKPHRKDGTKGGFVEISKQIIDTKIEWMVYRSGYMHECPKCKAEIWERSKFCDQCGIELVYPKGFKNYGEVLK